MFYCPSHTPRFVTRPSSGSRPFPTPVAGSSAPASLPPPPPFRRLRRRDTPAYGPGDHVLSGPGPFPGAACPAVSAMCEAAAGRTARSCRGKRGGRRGGPPLGSTDPARARTGPTRAIRRAPPAHRDLLRVRLELAAAAEAARTMRRRHRSLRQWPTGASDCGSSSQRSGRPFAPLQPGPGPAPWRSQRQGTIALSAAQWQCRPASESTAAAEPVLAEPVTPVNASEPVTSEPVTPANEESNACQ